MKNPVSTNWYADPESRVYGDTVFMYVTNSLPFDEQKNLDLVTTKDLESFEIYRDILDMSTYNGAFYFKGQHYVAYHRRIIGDADHNHRVLCIDKPDIKDGRLTPVSMT